MKQFLILFFNLFLVALSQAQSIYFSQFLEQPLYLNAAKVGLLKGDANRVVAQYRNEWASVTVPYHSYSIGLDGSVLGKKIENGHLGFGVLAMNDRSGDGSLQNFKTIMGISYHHYFDEKGKYSLAFGLQGGFSQKSVDFSKVTFPNQFNGSVFDNTNPNGEPLSLGNNFFTFDDIGAGIVWSYSEKGMNSFNPILKTYDFRTPDIEIGFSLSQINRGNNSFFMNAVNQLAYKPVLYGRARYFLKEGRMNLNLNPNFLIIHNGRLLEATIGATFEFYELLADLEKRSIYLGVQTRLFNAIVTSIGYAHKNIKLQVSYDTNITSLIPGSKTVGGFEITLAVLSKVERGIIHCPRKEDE